MIPSFFILFNLACTGHSCYIFLQQVSAEWPCQLLLNSNWLTGCCICVCYSTLDITSMDLQHNTHSKHIQQSKGSVFHPLTSSLPLYLYPCFSLSVKYSDPQSPVTWLAGRQEAHMHFPQFSESRAALEVLDHLCLCAGMIARP